MTTSRKDLEQLIGMVHIDIEQAKAEMNETFQIIKEVNAIKLKSALNRNIIFVGRSRSGKSTALKVMKDPRYKVQPISLYSETMGANVYSFTVATPRTDTNTPTSSAAEKIRPHNPAILDEANFINYNINIIDTPGLNEVLQKGKENEVRSNDQLKQIILKCMEHEITMLHAIFFVCNFANGVNNDDITAFTEFLELFQGSEQAICMLITNAEKFNKDQKAKLIEEIKDHPKMSQFMDKFNDRIFFTGSISDTDYQHGLVQAVHASALNVTEMRSKLYDFIFGCDKEFALKDIKFYKEQQAMAQSLQDRITAVEEALKASSTDAATCQTLQAEKIELVKKLDNLKGFLDSRMQAQVNAAATVTATTTTSR